MHQPKAQNLPQKNRHPLRLCLLPVLLCLSLGLSACNLPFLPTDNKPEQATVPTQDGNARRSLLQSPLSETFNTSSFLLSPLEDENQFMELMRGMDDRLLRLHRLFDIYHSYEGMNNLKTLNDQAGQGKVKVDADIIRLLQFGKEVHKLTNGRVNIAMGSVLKLWHDAREAALAHPDKASLPSEEALKEAALHCNIEDVVLDPQANTVEILDPQLRLDVGAIGKGFAAEEVCQWAQEAGYVSLALNMGGNVRVLGFRDGRSTPWNIAVQNPVPSESRPYLFVAKLVDQALITSGVYERYFEYKGERYHHLIDPDSLQPSRRYLSVSVLTESSAMGDALSTALFMLSEEEGKQLIDSLPNTEAYWVRPDQTEFATAGFEAKISQHFQAK